mgnify:CR=1 FL=1
MLINLKEHGYLMGESAQFRRDVLDGQSYGNLVHLCPHCGRRLQGILEIAYHGSLKPEMCFDSVFVKDTARPRMMFLPACNILYNAAISTIIRSACWDPDEDQL